MFKTPRILNSTKYYFELQSRFQSISIVLLILTSSVVASAQTINTLTQVNTQSDYFVDMNWSGTPSSNGCDCLYTDYFFIYEPCCPSTRFYEAPNRPHSTSAFAGTARFSLPPGTTNYSIAGQLGTFGARNFFGTCDFDCIANTATTTTVSTAALKTVTTPTQTHFFNASNMDLTLNWTVVTDIPANLYRLDIIENGQVLFTTTLKTVTSWSVNGLSFGSDHTYTVRTIYNNGEKQSDRAVNVNVPTPNGLITGRITTGPNGTGAPVGGVNVCAQRTTAVVG